MSFFNRFKAISAVFLPPRASARRRSGSVASLGLLGVLAVLPGAAHATSPVDALVAKGEIQRRELLHRELFEWRTVEAARHPRGVVSDAQALVGMSARRRIRAGQVLSPGLLEPALLVRRGERVTIVAQDGLVQAQTEGESLGDGHKGALIEARNLRSNKTVPVRVQARGVVSVVGSTPP